METTPTVRQATSSSGDRNLLFECLREVEPKTIADLLQLADLAVDVEAGRYELQTVVTGPSPVDSSNIEMGAPDDGMADRMMDAIGQAGGFGPRADEVTR
ncbi:UNVERIFIED_ORG: hypothetical protein L601_002000000540 [Gordonia westfalica J30]